MNGITTRAGRTRPRHYWHYGDMPMARRVQGKAALVTGGASGIGRGTAWLLAREGAQIAITDVNSEAGEALATAINAELGTKDAFFAHHDVTSEADWVQVIGTVQHRLGSLDILINNAGILIPGSIEDATLMDYQKLLRVDAESCFLGCEHGVRNMKQRGGAIVNMSSVSSWLPVSDYAAYSASKAAVAALARGAPPVARTGSTSGSIRCTPMLS